MEWTFIGFVATLTVLLVTVVFSLVTTFWQMRVNLKRMELSAKESGRIGGLAAHMNQKKDG